MILALQKLRRSEEGQTLVLAAIFGLILAVCVLTTVNIGRAVYDKMQLQTAADNAAYSQAAVEARVLNFTAYTNRAMVVHYASMMAATAYLTWVHFNYAALKPILTLLRAVPYAGVIAQWVDTILQVLVRILDVAVTALTAIVSAANIVLYGLQEGAWYAVALNRLSRIAPEAHSGDSTRRPYLPIWPQLTTAANILTFSQTRGHMLLPQSTFEAAQILLNTNNDKVQAARLQMIEIANSARQPWVAYGDRLNNPVFWPGPRHWRLRIACVQVGGVARTELGTFEPGFTARNLQNLTGQVWSGERSQFVVDCRVGPIRVQGWYEFLSVVNLDRLFGFANNTSLSTGKNSGGLVGTALRVIFGALLGSATRAALQIAQQTRPQPDYRPFVLSPYVYFSPRSSAKPGLGPAGALGNFAQPDVVVGLAKEGRDYNAEGGGSRWFGGTYTSRMGANRRVGRTDFQYGNVDWPRVGGLPLLHRGLNAFSAAQVYYHRPGDWKEQPNFFNPLWGARLMPVTESNSAAKLGITRNALFTQLVRH